MNEMNDTGQKETIEDIVDTAPYCEKCNNAPYFFLAVQHVMVSGCESHMIAIIKKFNKAGYLNRHVSHVEVPVQDNRDN